MKLWQKKDYNLNELIEAFVSGPNYIYDLEIAEYDIQTSIAHGKMLQKIGILKDNEFKDIKRELLEILELHQKDELKIDIQDEDIHTRIENILTEKLGDIAKKIHTARSRNDQVLTDMRLYSRDKFINLLDLLVDFSQTLLEFAKQYEMVPMPGYTHMQIAMPSSVGMWASSFVENILEDIRLINCAYEYNNMNPLGSGAGYGVSIDIDREFTTDLLGFDRVQINPIFCGNSRGKIDAIILSAIVNIALIFNKLATDILLFVTKEFGFFHPNRKLTTGSSIMPQKLNLDVMEIVRGRTSALIGTEASMKTLISNLPSGYNSDFQDTKRILIDSFSTIEQIIQVSTIVIQNLEVNEDRLSGAHLKEIFATDEAYKLVKQGVPFREAYKQIGENLDKVEMPDVKAVLREKKHIGATGNLKLNNFEILLTKIKTDNQERANKMEQIRKRLYNLD